ncbi:S24 family peptidase [Vibrio tubiashii]|uniref:S24 family peptidase n=1 Tax=Vibrio tubiashii TaxID=29498 RepID=UPI002E81A19C|nr:S24 family peptidase [Vibrio tubiashii]
MSVRGDSIEPTLKNQSIVMVNKIDDFASDGIYVFRFEGALLVKRLQFLAE